MLQIENHCCTDSENSELSNSNISEFSSDLDLEGYLEYSKRHNKYRNDVYLNKVLKAIKLGKNNLYDKINALSIACEEDREDVVKELLKFGDVLEMIRYDSDNHDDDLIESTETLNKIDKAQKTLHTTDNVNIVSLLLENGINIKPYGGNALRYAASSRYLLSIEIVQLLLDYGVSIDEPAKNGPGSTALTRACISNNSDIVSLLLKNGADIHVYNDYPLRMASYHGHVKIVKLLIKNGANINDSNALYNACFRSHSKKHEEIVKILLENGANVTNESLCAAINNPNIMSLLLETGPDIHTNNNKVLRVACSRKYGNIDVIKLLLKAGAIIDDKIIKVATDYGNSEKIIELLKNLHLLQDL